MTKPANGEVPASALALIQTGTYKGLAYSIYLETATAGAVEKARADGGITLAPPLGGYRSILDQTHLKDEPGQYGSPLPQSKIGTPGYSTHGDGDCFDVLAGNAWFAAHCGEYGCVRESPAGENNHYRYLYPTWAPSTSLASTGTSIPVPIPEQGDPDMATIYFKGDSSGAVFALNRDTGKKRNVTSSEFAIVNSSSTGAMPNFGAVSGGGLVVIPQASADAIPTE